MATAKTVLAIDPAKRSGFARGAVGSTPILESVNFGGRDFDNHADIFGRATKWCARIFSRERFELVVIEAPIGPTSHGTNYDTTQIALGLRAVFLGAANAWNIPAQEVAIATWRKYALGHGRMPGREAKRAAIALTKALAWEAPDHNAAEAACIWIYGCSLIDPQYAVRPEPLFVRGVA